jgi:nitroreductase
LDTVIKHAKTDYPVHELIQRRWSPYGFADRPVKDEDLRSLFEAARWAPSSYNEQPWSYIVARREDPGAFAQLLSCLVEPNQAWARQAAVLALGVTSLKFKRNDKPNKAAIHDLGLAAMSLTLEATSRGLSVHQMIGLLPDRARELYQVPPDQQVVTALAIGYAAEPESLPDQLRQRDTTARARKPIAEFVFAGAWGQAAAFVKDGKERDGQG